MVTTSPLPVIERVHLLDALRGFAIFGMWIVNMTVDVGWSYRIDLMPMTPLDFSAVTVVEGLMGGKFFTIFSFLFGVGVYVQIERLRARGAGHLAFLLRRSAALLLIAYLAIALTLRVWILVDYAVMGVALLPFVGRAPRTVLFAAVACFAIGLVSGTVVPIHQELSALRAEAARRGASMATAARMLEQEDLERALEREPAIRASPFLPSARLSLARSVESHADWRYYVERLGVLGLMLFGFYVAQRGAVWDAGVRRAMARRVLPWFLGVGAACSLYAAAAIDFGLANRFSVPSRLLADSLRDPVGATLMGLGFAAAFALFFDAGRFQRLLSPLAAVGRTALSCYLVTFLVSAFLNLGWGLGLFGSLMPAFGFTLVLVAFPFLAEAARAWLRYFRFGPAEWLWRSMTYGRWQPMRVHT